MFDEEKISSGDLRYICARNQHQAYDTLIRELKKSGLKQVQLAQRLGKGEDQISRLLNRPQNYTLDTYSELIHGISGAALKFSPDYPPLQMRVPPPGSVSALIPRCAPQLLSMLRSPARRLARPLRATTSR